MIPNVTAILLVSLFIVIIIFAVVFPPQQFENTEQKFSVGEPPKRPSQYHDFMNSQQIKGKMMDLAIAMPHFVSVFELTPSTHENNTIYAMEIKSNPHVKKSGILVIGCVDPMAWASATTIIELAIDVIYDPKVQLPLFTAYDWYMVPVANPDGLDYTLAVRDLPERQGAKWKRDMSKEHYRGANYHKNLAGDGKCFGVNIDRNFGYHWLDVDGEKDNPDDNPCSNFFPGEQPFSQSETCALRQYVDSLANVVEVAINIGATYDSKTESITYPWQYTNRRPDNIEILQKIGEMSAAKHPTSDGRVFEVYQSSQSVHIGGTLQDYQKGVVGTELVFNLKPFHPSFPKSKDAADKDAKDPEWERVSLLTGKNSDRNRPTAEFVRQASKLAAELVRTRHSLVHTRTLNFYGEEKQF